MLNYFIQQNFASYNMLKNGLGIYTLSIFEIIVYITLCYLG